jgi:hypothetical protein
VLKGFKYLRRPSRSGKTKTIQISLEPTSRSTENQNISKPKPTARKEYLTKPNRPIEEFKPLPSGFIFSIFQGF